MSNTKIDMGAFVSLSRHASPLAPPPKSIRLVNPIRLTCIILLFMIGGIWPAYSIRTGHAYVDPSVRGGPALLHALADPPGGHVFHLLTHGRPGELWVDGRWLGAPELARWIPRQTDPGAITGIYIYGCRFGEGPKGRQAVAYLQQRLGLPISASDDLTGRHGDWDLETGTPVKLKGPQAYAYTLQCPYGTYDTSPGVTWVSNGNQDGFTTVNENTPNDAGGRLYSDGANIVYSTPGGFRAGDVIRIRGNYLNDSRRGPLRLTSVGGSALNSGPVMGNAFPANAWGTVTYTIPAGTPTFAQLNVTGDTQNGIYVAIDAVTVARSTCYTCNINTPPALSTTEITNVCPDATYDLQSITASNTPSGAQLTWHTGTPATNANRIANPSAVSGNRFYAAFYSTANACYSGLNGTYTTVVDADPDSDCDGLSNLHDLDDDNDGVPDVTETKMCTVEDATPRAFVWDREAERTPAAHLAFFSSKPSFSMTAGSGANIPPSSSGLWFLENLNNNGTLPDAITKGDYQHAQFTTGENSLYVDGYVYLTLDPATTRIGILMDEDPNFGSPVTVNHADIAPVQSATLNQWKVFPVSHPLFLSANTTYYVRFYDVTTQTYVAHDELGLYFRVGNPENDCGGDKDTDGDLVADRLDPDSDGDGCSDALEAGATTDITANYRFTSADANQDGLVDAVDPDGNGTVNYPSTYLPYAVSSFYKACVDTDGDGAFDVRDIDDDNDGVLDRVECPNLFANIAVGGGFSDAHTPDWYKVVVPDYDTPNGIIMANTPNSTLTGGLFERIDGNNANTGNRSALINSPPRPLVGRLGAPLVAGAEYEFAFDLGGVVANGSPSQYYVVQLYNADLDMVSDTLAMDFLASLPGPNTQSPLAVNFKTISGTFTANATGQYYLVFLTTGLGGVTEDYVVDRVALRALSPAACDTDGDDVPDYLDLDSDADTCPDAEEAGVSGNPGAGTSMSASGGSLYSGGVAPGTDHAYVGNGTPPQYGANGFFNNIETAAESGMYNGSYTYDYATGSFVNACADTDGDGVKDIAEDIDDDNDGIVDAMEAPSCYYSSVEANTMVDISTRLASTTVGGMAVTPGNDIPTLRDGTSTSVATGNHVVAANQTGSTDAVIYGLHFPGPVILGSVTVIGATANWGTGSYAVLEGSNDHINYTVISTPLATSTGTTKTWTVVSPGTYTYFNHFRIRVSTVGSTNPSFTNYEVISTIGPWYRPSHNPKSICNTDTDGDGILNPNDLDRDGDGCPDLKEAGVSPTTDVAPSGDRLNSPGNDANGDGLNDSVDPDLDHAPNYASTYEYALARNQVACDSDGDTINDLADIDDDNDGILDATESPACFYTAAQAGTVTTVSTPLANDDGVNVNLPFMHDGTNTFVSASNNVITAGEAVNGKVVYDLVYPTAVRLASVSHYGTSFGNGATAMLQGSTDRVTWANLMTAPAVATGNPKTFAVNANTANSYRYYRIVKTAGSSVPAITSYEVAAVHNTANYAPSAHPKPACTNDTDGDGTYNHRDRDSDSDFCPDAKETGVPAPLMPGRVNTTNGSIADMPNAVREGPYGSNGLANGIENNDTESATTSYTSAYNTLALNPASDNCADPVAEADSKITSEGTPINDMVNENDTCTDTRCHFEPFALPQFGTLMLEPDGSFTYTPNDGFSGEDRFIYRICSLQEKCDTAVVRMYVVSPLPVTLVSFNAACKGNTVSLFWATASEINNERFIIQRSEDLATWEEVTTQKGAGNSNAILTYKATDPRPLEGTGYYRLIQQDYDGATETFGPISLNCNDKPQIGMSLYPNPATDYLTVSINVDRAVDRAEVTVVDMAGKSVLLKTAALAKGNNIVLLELRTLAAGYYVVRLNTHPQLPIPPAKLVIVR